MAERENGAVARGTSARRRSARGTRRPVVGETADRPAAYLLARVLLAAGGLTLVIWALQAAWRFPTAPTALAAGLLAYALVLVIRPALWLAVVPAALPVLVLALWSGRVLVNELDFLLAVSLGMALIRHGASLRGLGAGASVAVLIFLAGNLYVTYSGLYPLHTGGLGLRDDPLSSLAALRQGRGPLWALALLPVMLAHQARGVAVRRLFAIGMMAGIVTVSATVIWERLLFTGLFDLSDAYRVSGLFFGLVTGGAAIDAYLAITAPFAVIALALLRRPYGAVVALVLALLALYGLFVTYSRADYLAAGVIVTVLAAGWLLPRWRSRAPERPPRWPALAGLGAATLIIVTAAAALSGSYIAERFETVSADLDTRTAHWRRALGLLDSRDNGWWTGLGRGSFPREWYWAAGLGGDPLTAPRLDDSGAQPFLSLTPGRDDGSVFLRQRFATRGEHAFRLQMVLRAPQAADERLLVEFCQRHILKFRPECHWEGIDIPGDSRQWRTVNRPLDLASLNDGGWGPLKRPVDIAVMNRGVNNRIDIARVQLYRADGTPVLDNPGFHDGLTHWFFSYGNHLRWHTKNVAVYVLLEGGLLGAMVFAWFGLAGLVRLVGGVAGGDRDGTALPMLAALAGVLTIGLFDSLFDAHRIGFAVTLLVLMALMPAAAGPGSFKDDSLPPV